MVINDQRLDILQELVDTKEITEIMVHGKDNIFVEKNGRVVRWDRSFKSNEQLEDMIQQIVSRVNRVVNAGETTWTPDGHGHGFDNTSGTEDLVFMALIINS